MDFQVYKSTLSEHQLDLLKAVESNTLMDVQYHVRCSQNLDQDEQFSYILLVAALKREHKSIAKFLIKKNWPVKSPQKTGFYLTPLYYAVKIGDEKIFRALWRRGASIWDKDANQESALELAMLEHKTNMINYALDDIRLHKKSRELKPECEGDVVLFHAACWTSNSKAIEMFVTHNFSVRSRSVYVSDKWKGFTALHFAIEGEYILEKDISRLLDQDVDFYASDERGRTCINLAFRKGHIYLFTNDIVIDRIRNSNGNQSINPVDRSGLSHFHIFCSMKMGTEISDRHLDFIKHFIASGADVNSSVSLEDKKFPGLTALHFATERSSLKVLKLLLENGADPTKASKDGFTALHEASTYMGRKRKESCEIIKLLLQYGANSEAKDFRGRTPLHVGFNPLTDVYPLNESEKLLLSQNQQGINHTDDVGISYLHMACTGDDLGIIEALLTNGAPINLRIQSDASLHFGYSPLHFAVMALQVDVVEFLLTHGADPHCAADRILTPLHLACSYSNERFLERNFEIGGIDSDVDCALKRNKYIRIIELLIEHGASVNAEDSKGKTPLLEICTIPYIIYNLSSSQTKQALETLLCELHTRQKRVLDILLSHGANVNACSKNGKTILHSLIGSLSRCPLNQDLIKIVLKKGASVNAVDKDEGTPLYQSMRVSIKGGLGMSLINLLLAYGADINGKSTSDLKTPLHTAVQFHRSDSKYEDIIGSILDHPKIDLNAQDIYGKTALHRVFDSFYLPFIQKLLNSGANINLEDENEHPTFHSFLSHVRMYHERPNMRVRDYLKILNVIITHIKKLTRLNIFVSEKVQTFVEELSEYMSRDDLALIDFKIDEEIEKLKCEKMDQYTSLYDVIFMGLHSLAKYAQNENLLDVVRSIRSGQGYPVFVDIIERQYVKGCRRLTVLEPATIALNTVTKMDWPYCCSDRILSNLSDDELKDLTKSACVTENQKRSLEDFSLHEEPVQKIPRVVK